MDAFVYGYYYISSILLLVWSLRSILCCILCPLCTVKMCHLSAIHLSRCTYHSWHEAWQMDYRHVCTFTCMWMIVHIWWMELLVSCYIRSKWTAKSFQSNTRSNNSKYDTGRFDPKVFVNCEYKVRSNREVIGFIKQMRWWIMLCSEKYY